MFISIIIPAYNEEKRIKKTLLDICDFISNNNYQYEIIVVNDGSTDKTADVIRENFCKAPNLKLIDLKHKGKGFAIKSGMLCAKGDAVLFMDADNSTSVDQLENLLPFLSQGFDVVVGSRRIDGAKIETKQGIVRSVLGRVFHFICRTMFSITVQDTQNGFKLFSAEAAKKIFSRQAISGVAFDVEILTIAHSLGFKVKEVPIKWNNDEESKITAKRMAHSLIELVEIKRNERRGDYNDEREARE